MTKIALAFLVLFAACNSTRWDDGTHIRPVFLRATGDDELNAWADLVSQAIAEWNYSMAGHATPCTVPFVLEAPSFNSLPGDADANIKPIALVSATDWDCGGDCTDEDGLLGVEFEDRIDIWQDPRANAKPRTWVITHELGHAMGLPHVLAPHALMNAVPNVTPPTPLDAGNLRESLGCTP